jgi:hypothetical protein
MSPAPPGGDERGACSGEEDTNRCQDPGSVAAGASAVGRPELDVQLLHELLAGKRTLPYADLFPLPPIAGCPGGCSEEVYCSGGLGGEHVLCVCLGGGGQDGLIAGGHSKQGVLPRQSFLRIPDTVPAPSPTDSLKRTVFEIWGPASRKYQLVLYLYFGDQGESQSRCIDW